MKVKCPWCGREVDVFKDRLRPHIVHKGRQCVGGGFEYRHVELIIERKAERAAAMQFGKVKRKGRR